MREILELERLEARFVLGALEHYCAAHCPLKTGEGDCPLIGWRESVHTGAIERVCTLPAASWRLRLAPARRPRGRRCRG